MNYLIVDYGTSSCRASLVDDRGQIVDSCRKSALVDCRAESALVDIEYAWAVVVSAVRELLEKHDNPEISAVGVSSLLGWVFLDSSNKPLDGAIIWMDSRGSSKLQAAIDYDRDGIYRKTGRRLSSELLISKWAWLNEHSPETVSIAVSVISLKDELVRRLTGEIITDYAHLNYTMLWNIGEHRLDDQMLELADFQPDLLPEGGYPYTSAGKITAEAAAATGLRQGVPVIRGSIDGTTAMYGGGMAAADSAVLVSGTTDVVMTLIEPDDFSRIGEDRLLTVNTGMIPGTLAAGGSTGMSGGALTKISELLAGDYYELLAEAEKVPAGADGLLFCPALTGERAPYWDSRAAGVLDGLRMEHTAAHIIRAVMEGAALRLKRLFYELFQSTGLPTRIYTVGGCAEIDFWNGIKADASGLPLVKTLEPEATTIGTAMFCDCFINNTDDLTAAVVKWVKPAREFAVDSRNYAIYDKQFTAFENLVKGQRRER